MNNSRVLVGKVIKRIHQRYVPGVDVHGSGRGVWAIEAIEFDDGSFLRFFAIECQSTDHIVQGVYPGRRK